MRNPSFTKRGPGRRPAHVNKVLAQVLATLEGAKARAQKRKQAKKAGYVDVEVTSSRGTCIVAVFHDDDITHRAGRVCVDGNYVGAF